MYDVVKAEAHCVCPLFSLINVQSFSAQEVDTVPKINLNRFDKGQGGLGCSQQSRQHVYGHPCRAC